MHLLLNIIIQKKANCWANLSQVKQIRVIITKIIIRICKASSLKELFGKVLGNEIINEMSQKWKHIFLLENVTIRKVKSIKRPKIDLNHLNVMHTKTDLACVQVNKDKEEAK